MRETDEASHAHHLSARVRKPRALERRRPGLLVVLGLDDLAAPVKTVGADVVPQMDLTRCGLDCGRRRAEKIVGAMHATL